MRNIPIQLMADLQEDATYMTTLNLIQCKDGTILAWTGLDAPLVYDAGPDIAGGLGPITYLATNGYDVSRFEQTADMGVDNAEAKGWVNEIGISEQQIRAGIFDYGKFWQMAVNYMALDHGHILKLSGTTGETKFGVNSWTTELRSKKQRLKQPIGTVYSLTCRAVFGDEKCQYPVDTLWEAGTVEAVDPIEPDRVFTSSPLNPFLPPVPGLVRFLTGLNTGVEMEVESFQELGSAGDVDIALLLPIPYPMEIGDTFEFRPDCGKLHAPDLDPPYSDCMDRDNLLNFRGEPFIPVEDADSVQVPGAHTPGGGGLAGTDPE